MGPDWPRVVFMLTLGLLALAFAWGALAVSGWFVLAVLLAVVAMEDGLKR